MVIRTVSADSASQDPHWRAVFEDDFRDGLQVRAGRWRLRSAGAGLEAGDGYAAAGPDGLVVVPRHTDPETGEPAFTPTAAPLGEFDHIRWGAFADLPVDATGLLEVSARVSARGHGLDRHPYGPAVPDPHRELKCGAAALICVDRDTGIVLDFILTDRCLFAVYERLGHPGADYAAFSYAVPVTDREPGDEHDLTIRYDGAAGAAAWIADGRVALSVDRLGHRVLDARHAKRDNGGAERAVAPKQFSCGLGLFTDQVWGQGVQLTARHFTIRAAVDHTRGSHRGVH
jgi:Family of unknown function (DUF6081)